MDRDQVLKILESCRPLPYATSKEFVEAYEDGAESFMFVRTNTVEIAGCRAEIGAFPVEDVELLGTTVRCHDLFSDQGDRFYANGKYAGNAKHRIVRECDWEAALEAVGLGPKKAKAKVEPKVELCVPASDMPGIVAASKLPPPAPITPAPPFMVQLPKSSDGLLTVAPIWNPR